MSGLPIPGWPDEVTADPVTSGAVSSGPISSGPISSGPISSKIGNPGLGNSSVEDERVLLRAFRSFAHAADSLERSYGMLRAEVERLRCELEETQGKLRREQALAEMSAALAHEIRNPLGSLELFAGLLAESGLDGERRQWVEQVQAGLRMLAATVNNVLDFHSLPEPELAPTDLGQLLNWARDFFLPLASQSRVTLSLQNRLSGVTVAADRHRLEQVLSNLLINAVRALPGGGWIELSGRKLNDGSAAWLAVADTGPGIPPEIVGNIFEPGFSTRAGSPGLGLAVCRKIAEQHQGTIRAESRPGAGARFTLALPLPSHAGGGCN